MPPAEHCTAPDLEHPDTFTKCTKGSGLFGQWSVDDAGLVFYDYKLDQHADPRAAWPLTESDQDGEPVLRTDHFAAFGNRRVNAMLSNDGTIEVVTQDRGVEYLNKLDEAQNAWAGGFGYVGDGTETWCTAYRWRPKDSRTSRRFGMGYGETSVEYRNVRVERVTAAPPGSAPVVVSDVTLTNLGEEPKKLSHWEYWDVARRPIEINWLVSGTSIKLAPQTARESRDARNALFDETVSYDAGARRLFLQRSWAGKEPRLPREEPSAVDHWANSPFLLGALGSVSDVFVDKAAFFGGAGPEAPAAVAEGHAGSGLASGTASEKSGAEQPHLFVMKSDLELAPGEAKTLRFVYGYARAGDAPPDDPSWHDPSWRADEAYAADLRSRLMLFASSDAPELGRELAWHSYQVETSVGYRDYWHGHVVPQGSAYLYLHGADGAARDLGLFALPLVYTDPELAKEELRLFMGIQYADERFSYAFQGHGMLDSAGIHTAPSDLPLFFVWALGEYLGATGDLGFLDEHAPYWPREARPDARVSNHLVGALRHLFDVVGTGEHGLIRIGTGDWSDGIVVEAKDRELAVAKGESVPNTQMAVAVLPRIADVLEEREPALAAEIRTRVAGFRDALTKTWNGKFFYRAYFGDGKPVYENTINLESQIWALIGDSFASPGDRQTLIDAIAEKLDDPSPVGATLLPGTQVWPAISAPLTWGYALSDPERAWQHFAKNTMAAHAQAFPDVWYGIWSGPDGLSAKSGRAWKSQVTPMIDFPVQNNNAHAMPLLAALRVAGVDATATGLVIAPRVTDHPFTLRTRVVEVSVSASRVAGRYRPTGKGKRTLTLSAPPGRSIASLVAGGHNVDVGAAASSATLEVDPSSEDGLKFEMELSP